MRTLLSQTSLAVGESGSGKSTMARVITGLLPPLQGELTFNGTGLPKHYRDRPMPLLRQIQLII